MTGFTLVKVRDKIQESERDNLSLQEDKDETI